MPAAAEAVVRQRGTEGAASLWRPWRRPPRELHPVSTAQAEVKALQVRSINDHNLHPLQPRDSPRSGTVLLPFRGTCVTAWFEPVFRVTTFVMRSFDSFRMVLAYAAGGATGVEGRDDRAARQLAGALSQLQALRVFTLAPAPSNLNLWQRLEVLPELTTLNLVFYGPNAYSGTAGNAKDSAVHAVDALQYIRRLPELRELSLSCRRWSSRTEQVRISQCFSVSCSCQLCPHLQQYTVQ